MKKLSSLVLFLRVYSGFYPAFIRKVLFQSFRKSPAEQICVCDIVASLPLSKFMFATNVASLPLSKFTFATLSQVSR